MAIGKRYKTQEKVTKLKKTGAKLTKLQAQGKRSPPSPSPLWPPLVLPYSVHEYELRH